MSTRPAAAASPGGEAAGWRIGVLGLLGDTLPPGGAELLAAATLVVGGREPLARLAVGAPRQVPLAGDLGDALDALRTADAPAVVLAAGDPGFFGIVRRLGTALGPERLDVRPAPSSVATAFARLGLPWDDAVVVSAHARAPHAAIAAARRFPKVAVLTGPGAEPAVIAAGLDDGEVVVLERLGRADERIVRGTPAEIAALMFAAPNLVVALRGEPGARPDAWPPRTPPGWALPDDAFAHRAGMVTKAEVRALALARLGPGLGDLVWDVGCGSGSVGVECARLGAAVVAIDDDPRAVSLTRENAARHGVPVAIVEGRAPDALAALPIPDAAFVGGGGPDLEAIVDAAAASVRRAVVVTLATVERVGPVLARLEAHGLRVDAVQLAAARVRPLAGGHRLAAENPVFVLTGTRT